MHQSSAEIAGMIDLHLDRLGVDTKTACSLTGVSIRQINHWDGLGLVRPSVLAARGSGSRRRYALDDLFRLTLAVHLRSYDLNLERIAAALKVLQSCNLNQLAPDTLMVLAGDGVVSVGRTGDVVIASATRCGSAVVVSISHLAGKLLDACRLHFGQVNRDYASIRMTEPANDSITQEDMHRMDGAGDGDTAGSLRPRNRFQAIDQDNHRRAMPKKFQSGRKSIPPKWRSSRPVQPAASTWGESW